MWFRQIEKDSGPLESAFQQTKVAELLIGSCSTFTNTSFLFMMAAALTTCARFVLDEKVWYILGDWHKGHFSIRVTDGAQAWEGEGDSFFSRTKRCSIIIRLANRVLVDYFETLAYLRASGHRSCLFCLQYLCTKKGNKRALEAPRVSNRISSQHATGTFRSITPTPYLRHPYTSQEFKSLKSVRCIDQMVVVWNTVSLVNLQSGSTSEITC